MKTLLLILVTCHLSLITLFAETPIKDLNVTNTADIENGATLTFKPGSKLVVQPTHVIPGSDIDWSVSTKHSKTLSANITFTFSNVLDGSPPIIVAITNTASNYTVTWPAIIWQGGAAPVQTAGTKTDVCTFARIGSVIYGSCIQNMFTPTPTPTATPTATP